MKLLLVRHAIAVPRGTPGIPDDERPLTAKGERRFRRAARGLARVAWRQDAILTSPLPRALRTAEIAAKAWGRLEPKPQVALASGRVETVLGMLAAQPDDATDRDRRTRASALHAARTPPRELEESAAGLPQRWWRSPVARLTAAA